MLSGCMDWTSGTAFDVVIKNGTLLRWVDLDQQRYFSTPAPNVVIVDPVSNGMLNSLLLYLKKADRICSATFSSNCRNLAHMLAVRTFTPFYIYWPLSGGFRSPRWRLSYHSSSQDYKPTVLLNTFKQLYEPPRDKSFCVSLSSFCIVWR